MSIRRIARHLVEYHWRARRIFTPRVLDDIEQAIRAGEATHCGQLRFVVEGALDIFSHLRIWDTAHNNGVLIYLLLADRKVEIVGDRGIDARVGAAGWQAICRGMETDFRSGQFKSGVIKGIAAVSRELAKYFPPDAHPRNELPDKPIVI